MIKEIGILNMQIDNIQFERIIYKFPQSQKYITNCGIYNKITNCYDSKFNIAVDENFTPYKTGIMPFIEDGHQFSCNTLAIFSYCESYIIIKHSAGITIFNINTTEWFELHNVIILNNTLIAKDALNGKIMLFANDKHKYLHNYKDFHYCVGKYPKNCILTMNENKNELYDVCDQKVIMTIPVGYTYQDCFSDTQYIFKNDLSGLLILYESIEQQNCSICNENIKDKHAIDPCGHTILCVTCYDKLNDKKCPICRKDITKLIKLF